MKKSIASLVLAFLLVAILAIPAVAANDEASTTASVSVNEYVSITLSGGIAFGSVTPPAENLGATGQGDGTPAVTITVEGDTNVSVNISIKGEISSGDLALSNWQYSTLFDKSDITGLSTSFVDVYPVVGSGDYDFYHWITVPEGTTSGDHAVLVTYKAEN